MLAPYIENKRPILIYRHEQRQLKFIMYTIEI